MGSSQQRLRKLLWVLVLIGLLGVVVSTESYRTYHHAARGEATWCHLGNVSNCEQAYQSEYARLWGRPISLYGIVMYALLSASALLGLFNGGPYLLAALFHLGLAGVVLLGATCYFAWALFFQVKTLCILCLADYTVNLAFILVAWVGCWRFRLPWRALIRWDLRTLAGSPGAILRTLIAAVLLLGMGYAIDHAEKRYYFIVRNLDLVLHGDLERQPTPWTRAFPLDGAPEAPIHLVMFGDYECPFCRMTKATWQKLKKEYPGLIKVTSVTYPLNGDCNSEVEDNTHHAFVCKAAMLAEHTNEKLGPEAYFKVNTLLYATAHMFTDENLSAAAAKIGFSSQEIQSIWDESHNPDSRYLAAHYRAAAALGVDAIPVTLINGLRIHGHLEEWAWREILEAEAQRCGVDLRHYP